MAFALLALHVPADYLFAVFTLPEAIPVFWQQFVPFVYPSFAAVPLLITRRWVGRGVTHKNQNLRTGNQQAKGETKSARGKGEKDPQQR